VNHFGIPAANGTVRTGLGGYVGASDRTGLGNKAWGKEYINATAMSRK
jgi:hypothetical protein